MEKEHASDMGCCCFFKHQTFWITIISCTDVDIAIIKYSCVWKLVLCVFITSCKLTTKNKNVKTSRKINNIEKNEISITQLIFHLGPTARRHDCAGHNIAILRAP